MIDYWGDYNEAHRKVKPYQKPVPKQMTFDEIDKQFHRAVETDRKAEYYKRKSEYYSRENQMLTHSNNKPKVSHTLTRAEIEILFWSQLVQKGWRWHTWSRSSEGEKHIVLACSLCYYIVDEFPSLTDRDVKLITREDYAERMLKQHDCKPIEVEEDE